MNTISFKPRQVFTAGVWYHLGVTFDGIWVRLYTNGFFVERTANSSLDSSTGQFWIGGTPGSVSYKMNGDMSDFRVYDDALSDAEMNTIYTDGPNPGENAPWLLTPMVTRIGATLYEVVEGAQSYRLEIGESGSSDTRVTHDNISAFDAETTVTIGSLLPNTAYTVSLYVNSGSGFEHIVSEETQTLANSSANYDMAQYGSNGSYDLSSVDKNEFGYLHDVINDLFTTGQKIKLSLSRGKDSRVSFVRRGETVSTDASILAPFTPSAGSGQAFSMQLSDNSTIQVSYDETDDSLSIGGFGEVKVGDSLVIDGKKCSIKDI